MVSHFPSTSLVSGLSMKLLSTHKMADNETMEIPSSLKAQLTPNLPSDYPFTEDKVALKSIQAPEAYPRTFNK